jgi:hypothetical protein
MEWGYWSNWDCDVDCGKGWATRSRECKNITPKPHRDEDCSTACEGGAKAATDEEPCDLGCCDGKYIREL